MKYVSRNGKATVTFEKQEYSLNNQPFDNTFLSDTVVVDEAGTTPVKINCKKRLGGTYVYCNNPEMLASPDIDTVLMEDKHLSGDVVFTFENSNHSGVDLRMGYRLYNDSGKDATVTVTNIGVQWEGEWLGQKEWSDYYSLKFDLPEDYFNADGSVHEAYFGCDFVDYTPTLYVPQIITVPDGKYIYVMGGTSEDSYGGFTAGDTGDKFLKVGKCGNGVVKFNIEGEMTGSFLCYTDPQNVPYGKAQQGYIVTRDGRDYSAQYKGTDHTAGLIETEAVFVSGNDTADGPIPVTYDYWSDNNCASKNQPYQLYEREKFTYSGPAYHYAINPNGNDKYIGTDMMVFECVDTEGRPIIIDNDRADGAGKPANTGNWMIQYTDNLTFVNSSDCEKRFKVYKKGSISGVLATIVRDTAGNIKRAFMNVQPYSFNSPEEAFAGINKDKLMLSHGRYWPVMANGQPFPELLEERTLVYETVLQPKSAARISIDAIILANSCGGLETKVTSEKI
ncbi:MAG: hypothetical protein IKC06_04660 [Clostridia bacterium]|nr:hypothetical protein [Clostridia bacterium]